MGKFLVQLILFFLIILGPASLKAQSKTDIQQLSAVLSPPDYQYRPAHVGRGNARTLIQKLLAGMFVFYKQNISSQDGGGCTFVPSCSEYGLKSVQKQGVIVGMLATFDRLTRCHAHGRDDYDAVPNSQRVYDPVY